MRHLTKKAAGHLLKTLSGHLAKTCKTIVAGCTVACAIVFGEETEFGVDPEICWSSGLRNDTPLTETVTIVRMTTCGCEFNTEDPFWIIKLDGSGLEGQSFVLTYNPATNQWEGGPYDVTGLIKILRCDAADASMECNGCVPMTDITDTTAGVQLSLSWSPGGPIQGSFTIGGTSSPGFFFPPTTFTLGMNTGDASYSNTFTDCCTAWDATVDDVGCPGREHEVSIGILECSGVPCG